MSTPIINAKPEDLNTPEKRGKYTACIIGGGQIGILHAVLFAEAGFKVICFDSDQTVVNKLAKGKPDYLETHIAEKLRNHAKTKQITATSDIKKAVAVSDIITVTIPIKIDSKKKADYSNTEGTYKRIGQNLKIGSIIIAAKPTGIGTIENTLKQVIENTSGFKIGTDIGLAYSPLLSSSQRIVASTDKKSLDTASAVLELITKGEIKKTNNIKAAETAVLFKIQEQDINSALKNERADFCEKTNTDYLEVNELIENKANHAPAMPTNNVAREEPYLLLSDAENLNLKLHITETAREINEQTAKHAVNLVKDALKSCGKTPRRARISLLGISQTPNMKARPTKIVKEIAQALTAKGSRISLYDPYFSNEDLPEIPFRPKKTYSEAVEGADCILIISNHDQFEHLNLKKLKMMMKKPSAIVDLTGTIEPDKTEKEGFIYRGLGRGVWTK